MQKLFILIAEDDEVDRFLILKASQNSNCFHKIVIVNTAQDILDYLQKSPVLPDLILSDFNMPKHNAFDLLKKVKTIKRFASIPFFIYSTAFSAYDEQLSKELGVDAFFSKPFNFSEYENMFYPLKKHD